MSEGEEHAWSARRARELIEDEGDLLVPPSDKRSVQVRAVLERILAAVEEEERDVLNIREIVSIPGGWKPTHLHSGQAVNGGGDGPPTGGQAAAVDAADAQDDGPGCAAETDYLLDLERQREEKATAARVAAMSRRARRRRQRHPEEADDDDDDPKNVIEIRGWKVYLVESVSPRASLCLIA